MISDSLVFLLPRSLPTHAKKFKLARAVRTASEIAERAADAAIRLSTSNRTEPADRARPAEHRNPSQLGPEPIAKSTHNYQLRAESRPVQFSLLLSQNQLRWRDSPTAKQRASKAPIPVCQLPAEAGNRQRASERVSMPARADAAKDSVRIRASTTASFEHLRY